MGLALVTAATTQAQAKPAGTGGHAAQVPQVPRGAVRIGALSDNASIHVDVVLEPRDPAALNKFAVDVSTLGSAAFHHYLKPGEFATTFGPTGQTIAKVMAALRHSGLKPRAASGNGLSIPVTATAASLARAFSTRFVQYRLPGGRIAYANATAAVVPTAIAAYVQGIVGLDNLHQEHSQRAVAGSRRPAAKSHASRLQPSSTGPQPCSNAEDAGDLYGAFTSDQLATIYGLNGLYSKGDLGAGKTVAIYELEPNSTVDIATFQSCYHTTTSVSYVNVDSGPGTGFGEGEAALDIETVIGLAPAAHIQVYGGPNTGAGVIDTYNAIVDDDTAQVVSVSWAECEDFAGSDTLTAENTLFEQAAAQGQSIAVASGDTGSEACYRSGTGDTDLSVNDPASQPFATAVGGTTVLNPALPPHEVVWNEPGQGASGGGISDTWPEPAYQKSFVGTISHRGIPDVSADADPDTGYVIFYDGDWTAIGGTSAAAPLWAAIFALADNRCSTPIGFANPAIYQSFSLENPVGVGYDILPDPSSSTPDNNDFLGNNGGDYPTLTGYDLATGWGSPKADSVASQLCAYGGPGPDRVPGDFTGARHSDVAVFRPSNGTWYGTGSPGVQFGKRGDIAVAVDYSNAGHTDIAVFRPSNGTWYIRGLNSIRYGQAGDIPVPAPYDRRPNIAVFRPSNGTWYTSGRPSVQFGERGDIPAAGDFNGDGHADIAVFRPSNGTWYVHGGQTVQWGERGDVPVAGDFNGDGRTDIAVYRPSSGTWYVQGAAGVQWGARTDIPVVGDFNGDGHSDITVFRPSTGTWYIRGQRTVRYGKSGDVPAEKI